MTGLALACLVAAGASGADGAWLLVERAVRIAEHAPPSPVLDRVRTRARGADGLFQAELSESLIAVRESEPALALLDAAAVAPPCKARCLLDQAKRQAVLVLAEHALAAALLDAHLDAQDGKSSARAVSGVGRAITLAFLVEKCAGPALDAVQLSLEIHARARALVWHLAEQRLIDARDLLALAEQMTASAMPMSLERALASERLRTGKPFNLEAQARIDALGRTLDDATADRAALVSSAVAFESIPRPVAFDPMTVTLRCTKSSSLSFMVSRAVMRALELHGPELLGADSQVTPTFDGRGVEITRAGPLASSCGFQNGDLLVDVNGVATTRSDAVLTAPAQVAREVTRQGQAVFRVLREGRPLIWQVVMEGRAGGRQAEGGR